MTAGGEGEGGGRRTAEMLRMLGLYLDLGLEVHIQVRGDCDGVMCARCGNVLAAPGGSCRSSNAMLTNVSPLIYAPTQPKGKEKCCRCLRQH
jgi:hypothetical protein